MYNAQAQETERLIQDLRHRMARVEKRVTLVGQSDSMLWQNAGLGSGGGGGGGAFVAITPAIAAGASGTADVSQLVAGSPVLFLAGATIWNWYLSATTAGRRVTLCQNPDRSFTIYGQSCT